MNIAAAAFCIILLNSQFLSLESLHLRFHTNRHFHETNRSESCLWHQCLDGWLDSSTKNLERNIRNFIRISDWIFQPHRLCDERSSFRRATAVALAAMPIATAAYSVLRDRMHPGGKFWLFAVTGTFLSFAFFFSMNVNYLVFGDFLLILAVFAAPPSVM